MIRQATVGDADEIARIHVQTWQFAYVDMIPASYLQGLSEESSAVRWRDTLSSHPAAGVLISQEAGRIVGWTYFGPSRDDDAHMAGEIYALYVHPDHWRHGYGGQLMAAAETSLWRTDMNAITLWVLESNHPSRAFYAKVGYAFDGARKQLSIDGRDLWEVRYATQ